jgi:hypothetical protein
LKTLITFLTLAVLGAVTGCVPPAQRSASPGVGKELLTVNFRDGQSLRYKFISSRDIALDWGPMKGSSANKVDKSSESMEMIVVYKPVEVNPYGLTTIEATCESIKTRRIGGKARQTDPVETLSGSSFRFTVGPTGKIEDYSQLDSLIRQAGEKAFRSDSRAGRIKDPDMLGDFIATQWFLWDSVSSLETPAEGVSVGQSWTSKLSVPAPMVLRKARDVTYRLDEIRRTEAGKIAVIKSSYSPAEQVPDSWPKPYPAGGFRASGTFGFLKGYEVLDLQGAGEELFDIDAGRTLQYNQQYQMQMNASLLLPLGGVKPQITIEQNLSMQLLE